MDDTLAGLHIRDEGAVSYFDRLRRLACVKDREGRGLLFEIMKMVQEPDFQSFLLSDVGILIAGFLYLDDSEKKVHYLFFSDAKGEEAPGNSASRYYLPYLWKAPQNPTDEVLSQKSRLVDLFFVITRDEQSPFERGGIPWSGEKGFVDYYSEFALHLPRLLDDSQYPVLDGRERHIRNVYGFHYVPYGELVFFTFAWRLLFRRIVEPIVDVAESTISTKWNEWEWKAWTKGRFRARSIETAIQKSILSDRLWEDAWKTFTSKPKNSINESVWSFDDWISLRLLKQTGDSVSLGVAVRPLLIYLERLSSQRLVLNEFTDSIRTLREQLSRPIASGESCPVDEYAARLNDILCQVVALAPWTEDVDPTELRDPEEILLLLHRAARLPIVPYFYWNALLVQAEMADDGGELQGEDPLRVTHLVVPTWTTVSKDQIFAAPYWRLPQTSADLRSYTNVDCTEECRHLGFGVIGLRPWPELDWTTTIHESPDFERHADQKARRIFRLIERFSMPQIDAAFFGKIRKEALETAGKQEGVAELLWTFGHDAQRPARTVGLLLGKEDPTRVRVARFLAKNLENRLGAYPVIFAVTETREQKEQHLRDDIRFVASGGWRSLKSIWQEVIVDCLLRLLVDSDAIWRLIRKRWLGEEMASTILEKCLRHLAPLADRDIVTLEDLDRALDGCVAAFGEHMTLSCEESVFLPSILDIRIAKTQARAELAMAMLLSEIVTNAFKHTFIALERGQNPLFILGAKSVGERADMIIEIGPSLEPPRTDFSHEHNMKAVGLRSLKLMASVLGGTIATKTLTFAGGRFEELPFPSHESQQLRWRLSGLLIRPEDFRNAGV